MKRITKGRKCTNYMRRSGAYNELKRVMHDKRRYEEMGKKFNARILRKLSERAPHRSTKR